MADINQLHAGAAQVDITPPLGTRINGDFVSHFTTYIHDPLFAKCLVIQSGKEIFAWVIVDICVMSQSFIDPVKADINKLTDIPIQNILIASTHNHAAGSIEEVHLGSLDMAYRGRLASLIPEAAVMAHENIKPALFTWGKFDVPEHVLCRRYHMIDDYIPVNPVTGKEDQIKTNPFGLEKWIDRPVADPDPEVYYLALKSTENEWISVMANYSLHYVGDWENGTISADYFGVFANVLKDRLGAGNKFVAMMTNGTSGDINIWDFQRKKSYPDTYFEKSQVIGEDIAQKVVKKIQNNNHWTSTAELEVSNTSMTLTVRKPDSKNLERAQSIVQESDYENFVYSDAGLEKTYAREQVLLNEEPDARDLPLQVVRIGDLIIGALPGEFFAETGMHLKAKSEAEGYFTICLANGNVGYVPPAHEIIRGGYETWRCRYSCLVEDSEEKIRKELINMIRGLL